MGKSRAKPARSKPTRKAPKKPRAKASARLAPPPAAIEPSHTRGHVTAARMGRPARLTRGLIAEFVANLQLGLPLGHAAALCGVRSSQLSDWLRDGRRDAEAGRDTVAADFSEQVRRTLAEFQKQHLGSLVVYQRMAEGWSPSCPRCITKGAPCGRHRKNLRLAADLTWKMLVHRFPGDWNASTVRHEVGSGGDDEGATGGEAGEGEARPQPIAAAMMFFMPRRNDSV